MRAALEAKDERQRSIADYKQLVTAYRRVYLITPHAAEVPDALEEVAELYRTMGSAFDRSYFKSSVAAYQFLLHDYPESRYSADALLAVADIEKDNLDEPQAAEQAYEDFLAKYPHSQRTAAVYKNLEDMHSHGSVANRRNPFAPAATDDKPALLPANNARPAQAAPPAAGTGAVSSSETTSSDAAISGSPDSHIRIWNADNYTRIILDLGGQSKYQTARIANPDRIYFDIENAKLSAALLRNPIDVPPGGYLKTVRVAQNRPDTIRVVLEVDKVKDYSVFQLTNPDRLVVDVYGPNARTSKVAPASEVPVGDTPGQPASVSPAAAKTTASAATSAASPANVTVAGSTLTASSTPAKSKSVLRDGAAAASDSSNSANATGSKTVAAKAPSEPVESAKSAAAKLGPPSIPELTHDGSHSLTRALGLKTSRIVIDAGHGGHDTGTIGPTGLMEKDLCLDVALRLGKIIEQNFPSAEVIYTRSDDTFVPLEQRTDIANQEKADLFLSIHANSSHDRKVTGVETYYLNFNASPEAMEVATRENALAQGSVHDLEDMVTKIARNEKIQESRDFATDVEDALTKQAGRTGSQERNRGVRKAPFVVLIGANMPSVLAEISFLSNPADEQWLKKPESRQHVAEGLFQGVQSYLQSTNSLPAAASATALTPAPKKVSAHPSAVARASDQE